MYAGLLNVSGLQMWPYGFLCCFFFSVFPNLEDLKSSSIITIPLAFFHKEKYKVGNTSSSENEKNIYKFKMQAFLTFTVIRGRYVW